MPPRFVAPYWLPGRHAQTLWPLLRKPDLPPYQRERWETPDRDFIDLDWACGSPGGGGPLLVLFHGLEGSAASPYARALMHAVVRQGWQGVVPHFRGCSGELNRLPRAYHSGDSAEIDWILRRLRAMHAPQRLFAVGVSLGGNALLKWLGEQGASATAVIDCAAAVCAPVDLAASSQALSRGFSRLYTWHFLRPLKHSAQARLDRHGPLFRQDRMLTARSLADFDDAVTAPLHGFTGVADYYARASAKPWLSHIVVPTLMLNPLNDPFVPAAALPAPTGLSPSVQFETPPAGGHVGFVTGPFPGALDWLPHRLIHYFQHGT